ncbi:hypothetical protein OHA72_14615 [Dactylosporangium sp. NBC_01737]|uniref:DUF4350 domain-containing protein n=1 Tax=Dactylosporangium sp. NBC_01737 TaxID=2975959 RepID=UPI002E11BB23|nr:hypothetical protein OHA72_14615 [Dactylosporangium sp. NBC_01737]
MKTKTPRSRRWLRLAVPPVAVLLVLLTGLVLYQWEQPDEDDPAYLSPVSSAAIGAGTLADRVRAAGVTITRVGSTADAFRAEHRGDVTILLTTPQFVHPEYLRRLALLPGSTHVVAVEPSRETLLRGQLPIAGTDRALVSRVSAPGCDYRAAADAGRAGVRRTRYGVIDTRVEQQLARCYDDSLVVFSRGWTTMAVVGSADPFRNDRIGEFGNAALAVGLLTARPRLVWVDLHHREAPPKPEEDPYGGPTVQASATAGTPTGTPTRETARPTTPATGSGRGQSSPQPQSGGSAEAGDADPPNPLWHAFPVWTYVVAVLLVVAFLLYALARARRMGGPVVEPLPVVVRAGETVTGRGRLYRRARAREESLATLRSAALSRMARLLRLEPGTDRETIVATVAGSSGWPPYTVRDTLFGAPPEDDDSLVIAAVQLEALSQALSEAVTTEQPDAAEGARR